MLFLYLALCFTLAIFGCNAIEEPNLFDLTNFHGMPSAIVGGHVNVITGDFIDYELDCLLPGPEAFPLERVYTSSVEENNTFGLGWRINHNYSAEWAIDAGLFYTPEIPVKGTHYFTIADGLGGKIRYRGSHTENPYCKGNYRTEKILWERGMTNVTGEGISGKRNVKNNEVMLDSKSGSLRYGNGDVLFFDSVYSTQMNADFLPTIKKKMNRLKESYSFSGSKLSSVKFYGCESEKLGFYQFKYEYPDEGKEILVESPIGTVRYFYDETGHATPTYLLRKVVRPHHPTVKYDYEKAYVSAYMSKKHYPNNRYIEVDYYHRANKKVKHYPGDRPAGIVKSISRPLGETNSPVKEYEFIYQHSSHKSSFHFNGYTDVIDALGFLKKYYFEKSRLTEIESFVNYRKYRTEENLWGTSRNTEGYFLGKRIKNASDEIQLETSLEYDSFGNVAKESLKGNLRGHGTLDNYTKEMTYSQDGKNLLLEEKDYLKKVVYRYLEGTNLICARFLSDHHKYGKREFFFYDQNGFKIKEVIDDGLSDNYEDLTGVTERRSIEYKPRSTYPFGLAEEVVYKAYDLIAGVEKQLKRIRHHYTVEGWLQQSDTFNADDHHAFSQKYRYNNNGKVIYEEDPTGAVIEYAYDENNNKIEEKGPLPGYRKVFQYDFSNRLNKETEILENENLHLVKSYKYNYKSECIEETDISGNTTKHAYDELGRKISTEYPLFFSETGFTTTKSHTEYDCLDNPCVQIDTKGNKTSTKHTIRGKPFYIEYPDGTVEKMAYDLDGTLRESVDKYGNKTVISSDYLARPLSKEVYSPSGDLLKRSTCEYNAFHLLKETDEIGAETRYEYDFAGRLIRKMQGASIEEYSYDSLSRLFETVTWTTGNGAVVVNKRFNNNGLVIKETTRSLSGTMQARVCYEYNALGKKTKEERLVKKDEAVTRYIYNARGDLIETINPLGVSTKILYDYHVVDARGERGTRVISIDPKGVLTIIDKNAIGLEKRGEKKNSLGETLQLWDYLYNSTGEKCKRIEVVYTAGKPVRHVITAWVWDSLGRLGHLIEAHGSIDEKITSITYNSYGQRASIIKPSGRQNLFSYDTLGRMSRWYSSDNSFDYRYSYDASDNLLIAEDELHGTATVKTYDIHGRLIEEVQGTGLAVNYDYDKAGRVCRFIYPDGTSVAYEYKGARISEIKRFTESNVEAYCFKATDYDHRGKLLKAKLPLKAGEYVTTHDLMGRTTKIQTKGWKEQVAGYDSAGNLLERTVEDPTGTLHETYAYDELNQLIEEKGAAAHKYRFDSLLNRIKEDESDNTVNDLNQVIERKDRSYRYDADGNLIEVQKPDKTLRFGYDAAGRMTSFTDGTTTATYRYDEANRRIFKIVNYTEITRFVYNGQCELGTLDYEGEIRILGGLGLGAEIGEAIAIEKGNSVFCPVHDHNGNLMSLIDARTGLTASHFRYSAFGMEVAAQGEHVSWGFSSKRKDHESGLLFFGRRYYDPESGRFITKDPLGDRDGPNLYAYVSNNPLMFIDLWGLITERNSENGFAPMRWLRSGLDYIGNFIESFSTNFIPPSPFQYVGEGIGRVLQGKKFKHTDYYARPIVRNLHLGKEIDGSTRIAITGMKTYDDESHDFAVKVQEGTEGSSVHWQSHRSTGFLNDLWNVLHLLLGVQTDATRALAQTITREYNKWIERGITTPLISLFAHSRGGLEAYRAMDLLPKEIKSCLCVYTFGSAYLIPPDGLHDAVNYINPKDLVPKLASVYCAGNGARVITTDYRTEGMFNFLADHALETPGYQDAIMDACADLREKMGRRFK